MPAFFFISGFCSNFNKSCKSFVVSLFKQLILPLFTLSIIGKILHVLCFSHTELLPEILAALKAGGTLWFLKALIICKIICFIGSKVTKSRFALLIMSSILLIVGVVLNQFSVGENIFYYKHALVAGFFVALGYYLKENQTLYEKALKWSLYLYPFVAIATFIFTTSLTADIGVTIKSLTVFVAYSTIGTLFLLQVCRKIQSNRILEYWGQNSLVVYGLHFTPLICFFKLYYDLIQPDTTILFMVFITILFISVYAACYAEMKIFEYKPFKWLIGKF